jgi:hypothetical protein
MLTGIILSASMASIQLKELQMKISLMLISTTCFLCSSFSNFVFFDATDVTSQVRSFASATVQNLGGVSATDPQLGGMYRNGGESNQSYAEAIEPLSMSSSRTGTFFSLTRTNEPIEGNNTENSHIATAHAYNFSGAAIVGSTASGNGKAEGKYKFTVYPVLPGQKRIVYQEIGTAFVCLGRVNTNAFGASKVKCYTGFIFGNFTNANGVHNRDYTGAYWLNGELIQFSNDPNQSYFVGEKEVTIPANSQILNESEIWSNLGNSQCVDGASIWFSVHSVISSRSRVVGGVVAGGGGGGGDPGVE